MKLQFTECSFYYTSNLNLSASAATMKVAIICIHSSACTCNCLPMTQINKQQRLYAIVSICKTHAVKSRQHLDCLLADLLTSAADLLTNSPSTSYNLFHTNRCNQGVLRFSTLIFHHFAMTKIMQIHNLSALNRRQLTVSDRKSAACWKSSPAVYGCRRFNAQRITGFTLQLIICANSCKNSTTLKLFSTTFP